MQLSFHDHPAHFQRVIDAALEAADPAAALERAWPQDGRVAELLRGGVLVAAGKASATMAMAAVERLGVRPSVGVVLAPAGTRAAPAFHRVGIRVFEVDHPLPTQRNLIAAQAVADAARLASSRKVPLLALISGGASAHLTVPNRGLTLSDIRNVTDALLRAGATIGELNAVRGASEQLKAGGLARLAAPSPVYAFILSDVLGDPLPVIGSGPTVDVDASPKQALRVLEQRGLIDAAPNVAANLRKQVDAPVVRQPLAVQPVNSIIGSNRTALRAVRDALAGMGFEVEARECVEGEAALLGRKMVEKLIAARQMKPDRPVALVWGGETTVHVGPPNPSGHHPGARPACFGGRNQEAALGAALALQGQRDAAVLCFATDGVDGATPPGGAPHAGAIATPGSAEVARRAGVEPEDALARHDSYGFCRAAECAVKTGPTGTNVNDVWVGLGY